MTSGPAPRPIEDVAAAVIARDAAVDAAGRPGKQPTSVATGGAHIGVVGDRVPARQGGGFLGGIGRWIAAIVVLAVGAIVIVVGSNLLGSGGTATTPSSPPASQPGPSQPAASGSPSASAAPPSSAPPQTASGEIVGRLVGAGVLTSTEIGAAVGVGDAVGDLAFTDPTQSTTVTDRAADFTDLTILTSDLDATEVGRLEDRYPCDGTPPPDELVVCSTTPLPLPAGPIVFVAFGLNGPPPFSYEGNQWLYFNVVSDADGDLMNNDLAQAPFLAHPGIGTDRWIQLGYIQSLFTGAATDLTGPPGPSGSRQFNDTTGWRLALSQMPAGGLLFGPASELDHGLRLNSTRITGSPISAQTTATDWVSGPGGPFDFLPLMGPLVPPDLILTQGCGSVTHQPLSRPQRTFPSYTTETFVLPPGFEVPEGSTIDLTLDEDGTELVQTGIPLQVDPGPAGLSAVSASFGITKYGPKRIVRLVLTKPGGPPVDITEAFHDLFGPGFVVTAAEGPAAGIDCP